MVEDALETELEVTVVGGAEVMTLLRDGRQQRGGLRVDRHRVVDVAVRLLPGQVLLPESLQDHRPRTWTDIAE